MAVDHKQTKIDHFVNELQKKCTAVVMEVTEGEDESKCMGLLADMERCLKKVRDAQRRGPKKDVTDGPKDTKPFLKWLKDNGIQTEDVDIFYDNEKGHGLKATKDYKAGDLLFQVPYKLMMTNKTALESSKVALLLHNDNLLQSIKTGSLALHLLVERYTLNSYWTNYINMLPKVINVPIFWTIEELSLLAGTYALTEAIKLKATCVKQYCHVYFRLEELNDSVMKRSVFTYDAFSWAYATILARQNNIQLKVAENKIVESFALIPLFDFLNHEPEGVITTDCDPENHLMKCYAKRDFKKGEELRIFYGPRANIELLLYQGFTLPVNKHNWIPMVIGLMEQDDDLKRDKLEILQKHGYDDLQYGFVLVKEKPLSEQFLAFLRVAWLTNKKELKDAELAFQSRAISLENELRVALMLIQKISYIIENLKSPPLEELKKKQKNAKTVNEKNAYQLIIDEKDILEAALVASRKKRKTVITRMKDKAKKKGEIYAFDEDEFFAPLQQPKWNQNNKAYAIRKPDQYNKPYAVRKPNPPNNQNNKPYAIRKPNPPNQTNSPNNQANKSSSNQTNSGVELFDDWDD